MSDLGITWVYALSAPVKENFGAVVASDRPNLASGHMPNLLGF
jgi:hypothetical protein